VLAFPEPEALSQRLSAAGFSRVGFERLTAASAPSTMALDNLREFVRAIDDAGDLVRVEHPVSVDREITEIADRCMKSPAAGRPCCHAPHVAR